MSYRRYGRGVKKQTQHVRDEFVAVLDFIPNGNPVDRHWRHRTSPLIQSIGTKYFTLVEIVPTTIKMYGPGERYLIYELNPRGDAVKIVYDDLTSIARSNLTQVLRQIILEKEKVFVQLFNIAEPINIRMHTLELLPGIGKKSLALILDERKKKPFDSFKDIQERLRINDPAKMIVDRIIAELQGNEKYYLFVDPPEHSPGIKLGYLERIYLLVGYREPW
mgnify:CR=1 FL=1